jgi:HEAT repeat protein
MQAVSSASVINALERTVRNKSENPDVRGYAAETLAHRHRRSTHNLLIKALQDPSKDVRFWCAFALGQMREKKAVSVLQLLLSDQRLVRGFHSVAKEAADAISEIEQREPKRRCPYCIRRGRPR